MDCRQARRRLEPEHASPTYSPMTLLSLFSGCGGLDLGFEEAGYNIGLAYERRKAAVLSYNANAATPVARVCDIRSLTLDQMDSDFGGQFAPSGVIGGPPCQSFSRGNAGRSQPDPRSSLVGTFFSLALGLHQRRPLDFIVMENVPEIARAQGGELLDEELQRLRGAGFSTTVLRLDAKDFGIPQTRRRLFVIAINERALRSKWRPPPPVVPRLTVADALKGLPDPIYFCDVVKGKDIPFHGNHWCMTPRSRRFFDGSLSEGYRKGRSFKTLAWLEPSLTVSYGHREVHVHPNCKRRLSVYEAMLLQGFPPRMILKGTLSDQFSQVSEAVPPPLARAIAASLRAAIDPRDTAELQSPRENSQLPLRAHG